MSSSLGFFVQFPVFRAQGGWRDGYPPSWIRAGALCPSACELWAHSLPSPSLPSRSPQPPKFLVSNSQTPLRQNPHLGLLPGVDPEASWLRVRGCWAEVTEPGHPDQEESPPLPFSRPFCFGGNSGGACGEDEGKNSLFTPERILWRILMIKQCPGKRSTVFPTLFGLVFFPCKFQGGE